MRAADPHPVVRVLRIVMPIVAIVCAVVFPPWNGILAWLAPLPETVQEQVDAAIDRGLDGIVVYVDRAGQPPALFAAGWKDRAAQVPADPRALFKIASISKLYLAAATVKLVESGRVSLDDTLAEHAPELVGRIEHVDTITLRTMLRHRSGIPNFTDHPEYPWGETLPDRGAYLDFALDQPAVFAPDERYRYSNTNYLLIGTILDRVLGYDHHRYVEEALLVPLGLTDTFGLRDEAPSLDLVASGYHSGVEADLKELDHRAPGGSMVATAQDVGTFVRALVDGSLLTDAEQATYASVSAYEHTGWLLGYQSIARYHDDIDAVVVLFANTTGGDSELVSSVVYDRIVRILRR